MNSPLFSRGLRDGAHRRRTLALFPSFAAEPFGGVQVSGKEAWSKVAGCPGVEANAFHYDPHQTKWANLMRAGRSRTATDTLLVWHLGLLKLAPVIAPGDPRVVVFLHGIEAWRRQDPLTSLLMRRADLFLSNSDFTWNRFAELHPACTGKPHRTVHLGLGDALRCAPSAPQAAPSALMIGRMCRGEGYKGHREIIEIWPEVLARVPEAELRIIGGGDLQPELEALVRDRALGGQVRFYGAVPDAQKEELLQQCRVLVLPSAGEGFGLVYLEAMRMGRPCIVSEVDAGREVVNPPEAGLAVDVNDSGQAADAVIRLLTPGPEWDAMSARARQRYESAFTAAHFARRLQGALFED